MKILRSTKRYFKVWFEYQTHRKTIVEKTAIVRDYRSLKEVLNCIDPGTQARAVMKQSLDSGFITRDEFESLRKLYAPTAKEDRDREAKAVVNREAFEKYTQSPAFKKLEAENDRCISLYLGGKEPLDDWVVKGTAIEKLYN